MKRCPNCGGIYADDVDLCGDCKIVLVDSLNYYNESCKLAHNKREESLKSDIQLPQRTKTPSQVSCPKCGSTQIQMVTRKWSLLTGFMTNKVDRVCMNCKCKF